MVLVVIVGNMGMYWQQVLWRDDYYYGVFRWRYELKSMPSLSTEGLIYFNRAMCWIAGNFSQHLARSVYLLGIMVPASLVLFGILRKSKYPLPVAFFASSMMWVFPGQSEIPYFVNGSYIAEALLLMLLGFWCGLEFLQKQDKSRWGWLLGCLILFYGGQRISELILPTTLMLAVLYLVFDRFGKRAWVLVGSLGALSTFQLYRVLYHGRKVVSDGVPLSVEGVERVIGAFANMCIPSTGFRAIDSHKLWILAIAVIAAITLFVFRGLMEVSARTRSAKWTSEHQANAGAFIVRAFAPLAIMIMILLAMAKAPWFSPRHAVLPATGLFLFLSYTYATVLCRFPRAVTVGLLLFVSVSALRHTQSAIAKYAKYNDPHNAFVEFVETREFPQGAQIVVADMDVGSGEYLEWSTGYLSYVLDRTDIAGVIGEEVMLMNSFSKVRGIRGWTAGLDLSAPVFLYRRSGTGFEQIDHFLHRHEDEVDGSYVVFRVDPVSGYKDAIAEGNGLEELGHTLGLLEERGVERSDILWAGELL